MSDFVVKVRRIEAIEPIPNADAIELAVVGDYRSVVRKGDFRVGNLAVYIPEASVVPAWLLERMNLVGKLAGADKNRVKAIKLRGCLSQGILYPVYTDKFPTDYFIAGRDDYDTMYVSEGDNVAEFLEIIKYEPVIPAHFAGEIYNAGLNVTVHYDIENYKSFPSVLVTGEEVVFTEKLHGTFCGVGILPKKDRKDKHYKGKFVVFSKGLGGRGLCFSECDNNKNNVYIRALEKVGIFSKLEYLTEDLSIYPYVPFFVLGEVHGKGVQDLHYGQELGFRVFDMCYGYRETLEYVYFDPMCDMANIMQLSTVPVLYRGPFSKEAMLEHTRGTETVSGTGTHMREGIVIKPVKERRHNDIGRVILKSVSEDYLLRKGNTTEFQ